jgi:hypothetical protein
MRTRSLIGAMLAAALLGTAHAQVASPPATGAANFPLFKPGRPLPECASFMITELGLGRMTRSGAEQSSRFVLTGDVGYMRNISPLSAVGASLHAATTNGGSSLGVKFRYRRWLKGAQSRPGRASVELGAGLMLFGHEKCWVPVNDHDCAEWGDCEDYRAIAYPRPVVSASLNLGDIASLMLQIERAGVEGAPAQVRSSASLRFGSYASLVSGVAGLVSLAIALHDWAGY